MQRIFLKSKIHRARVTDKNLNYEGSLTIDATLMKKADILPGEFVQVINVTNGNRFETYAMRGKPNSGAIVLNGGTARLGEIGDEVIIITYCNLDSLEMKSFKPKVVLVDKKNRIVE